MTPTDRAYLALCLTVYAMGWKIALDRIDVVLAGIEGESRR